MKILVLADEIPATTRMPGSPRLFSLCRELAKRHDLWLLALDTNPERYPELTGDPDAAGVFREIARVAPSGGPGFWGRQLHRFRFEPHLSTRFRDPSFHAELCRIVAEKSTSKPGVDVILADRLRMAQYVTTRTPVPAIVDLHDSMTLLFGRKAEREEQPRRRLSLRIEARGLARWEKNLGRRFTRVVVNSERDEVAIRDLDPSVPVTTIPNGVDTDYFAPACGAADPPRLVFTGVMAYGPNDDAVRYFASEIFPRIRSQERDAEFWAVGHEPTPEVRRLGDDPAIEVTGSVDDVRPYVQSASAFVCPLRYGAGIKNKILAAMAMGRPVIATSLSLDGIDAKPEEEVLLADDPDTFAAQAIRVLRDEELARRLSENGRRFVLARHSWQRSAEVLERALLEAVSR